MRESVRQQKKGGKQGGGPAMAFIRPKPALKGHGKCMGGPEIAQKTLKGQNSHGSARFPCARQRFQTLKVYIIAYKSYITIKKPSLNILTSLAWHRYAMLGTYVNSEHQNSYIYCESNKTPGNTIFCVLNSCIWD